MASKGVSPLLTFLAGGIAVDQLSPEDSSLLLAEARATGLLCRLAHTILNSRIKPEQSHFEEQLRAAEVYAEGFRRDVWRELAHIEEALSGLNAPVLLLKGASYVLLGLPAADGRIFSDIDVLVAKDRIAAAEAGLMLGGWATGKLDAYDQRYYREWSHEIPPMTHLQRGTTIDLHHSLAMPTCRIRVDSARMIADAIPVGNGTVWWRLKDEDMVLHAASHLLLNSEFDRGLRDIWDIDLLYRHFSSLSPNFSDRLFSRSREIGLEAILDQSLHLASTFFNTPIAGHRPLYRNNPFGILLAQAATTRHPDTRPRWQKIADLALLLREMYLRLPNRLLATHLLHKLLESFSTAKQTSI